MSLAKTERAQLRQLMQQPQWRAFEHLVEEFVAKIKDESIVQDSEWDTLKKALMNEGQARGIRNLIQETYLQIQQHEDETV